MQIIYELYINYDLSCAVNPKLMFENKHLRLFFWSLKTRPNQKGNSYELQPSFIQRRATILPTQILSSHWSIANHPSNPMSTHHCHQSSIHSLLSAVFYPLSTIHSLLSTVFHSQFTINRLPSTVHPLPSIAYRHLLIINSGALTGFLGRRKN